MPRAAKRCRPLFDKALAQSTDKREFYRGVIVAYCEKLTLGVCRACMLRPDEDDREMVEGLLSELCELYGCEFSRAVVADAYVELWFTAHMSKKALIAEMYYWGCEEPNSPAWHRKRGQLVGIPDNLIDEHYHER